MPFAIVTSLAAVSLSVDRAGQPPTACGVDTPIGMSL
jgi:hypothetical protein